MKTRLLIGLATTGLAWGALGQGCFVLNTTALAHGIAIDAPGNWYDGVLGLEVWELNGANTDLMEAINFGMGAGEAYRLLAANGFKLETTYSGQAITHGDMVLGTCYMPDVSPAGNTVTVALVAWNTSESSFSSFEKSTGQTRAGIIAFLQPTAQYTYGQLPPKIPPPLAWDLDLDLVMYDLERPPAIASQPQDTTAALGSTATFTVTVGGESFFDYQWRFNGNEMPAGAYPSTVSTNAKFHQLITYSLILTNVQTTNAGQYSFFITNFWDFGAVVSSNATLTVTLPPPILCIAPANPGVTLTWPIWATNYAPQEAMALSAPTATWSNAAVNPVIGAHDIRVTLEPAAGHKFYRLLER